MAFGNGKKAPPTLADGIQKNVFILCMPGGGVLNLITGMILREIERYTERHTLDLFHILDLTSGGAILGAGLSSPGIDAAKGFKLYFTHAPGFLPRIPKNEMARMVRHTFNALSQYFGIDPLYADKKKIGNIEKICGILKEKCTEQILIEAIRKAATGRWISDRQKRDITAKCRNLTDLHPEISIEIEALLKNVQRRQTAGFVSALFRKCAIMGIGHINRRYSGNLFLDRSYANSLYRQLFGDMRLSDFRRSTYISANDVRNRRPSSFFCRKQDLFAAPGGKTAETSLPNHLITDVVPASTSHRGAFDYYAIGDAIYDDMATLHVPLAAIEEAIRYKQQDAGIKLIVIHYGMQSPLYESTEEALRAHHETGILGSLLSGELLATVRQYVMGMAQIEERLGAENVIELMPRLYPMHPDETPEDFPSSDILDSSRRNRKITVKNGRRVIRELNLPIRQLSQELIDTCFASGHMTGADYLRITKKIGVKDITEPSISNDNAPVSLGSGWRAALSRRSWWLPSLPSLPSLRIRGNGQNGHSAAPD